MVFSSNIFLLYFLPIFLLAYFITPQKFRNYTLLLFSLVFYAYGAPDFVLILVASCILNYFVVRWMAATVTQRKRKLVCALSILISLGLLLYFKYANFFVDNLNALLGLAHRDAIPWVKVALPIGISFFSFQSVTYTIDVYRGTSQPSRKLTDYVLYIMMFPQLIAGPIVRYSTVAQQIVERKTTAEDFVAGFYRFVIGLSKKVLIANTLAYYADYAFGMNSAELSSGTAWIGILAYTMQIYFDFSGYSDMAIGLGRMMGFRFPENFNDPYTSQSISEFWRRWHITLGAFMKEYLYIPLGGNRKGTARTYLNLAIVFLCSGFWHGAAWNFIFWGVFHGLFIILDRLFMLNVLKKIGKIPSAILTFFVVNMGWVLFRAEDFSSALGYYQALFSFRSGGVTGMTAHVWVVLVLALLFSFITMAPKGQVLQDKVFVHPYTKKSAIVMAVVVLVLFVLSVGSLFVTGFNPFIYFHF